MKNDAAVWVGTCDLIQCLSSAIAFEHIYFRISLYPLKRKPFLTTFQLFPQTKALCVQRFILSALLRSALLLPKFTIWNARVLSHLSACKTCRVLKIAINYPKWIMRYMNCKHASCKLRILFSSHIFGKWCNSPLFLKT